MIPSMAKAASRFRMRLPPRVWSRWPNERLLDLPLRNLDLSIEGTILEERIEKVAQELESRNIRFRPRFWLSDDWFTPDGCTGSAIPFYLAHPRLTRLERSQMGEVEGGTHDWCMMLLRHEVGHALDNAFVLHRRRRRQQLFGLSSHSYPRFYRPNPYSKRYVQHLEYWYAQSHPDEDFAETFAVWLKPRSGWRKQYQGWPALKKLEYVDELMSEIAGEKPAILNRTRGDALPSLRKTLREHYALKRAAYGGEYPGWYDEDLKRLFTNTRVGKKRETAAAFIRRVRPELLRKVSPWMGNNRYVLDQLLYDLAGRCRDLRLRVRGSERRAKSELAIVLTKQAVDYVYRRHRWVEV
jgi:hypothetical protein